MSNWPQWLYAVFLAISLVYHIYDDGKKQSVSGVIVSIIIFPGLAFVLYCGGFWAPWGFQP